MSNKKRISIKDYFNAPSSITQPTVEPSNESAGNTSTSPPNEETNDKQHPPLSENQLYHPDSSYVFPETVFGKQKQSCKHDWFKRISWLDYNAFDVSVTCYMRQRQNNQDSLKTEWCKENAFRKKVLKIEGTREIRKASINPVSPNIIYLQNTHSSMSWCCWIVW